MANYNVTIGSTSTNVTVGYRPTLGVTQQASGIVGPAGPSYWTLTSAGIHTLSNVGIGTTNPTSKLHVVGNVLVSGIVTATSFSGNATSATYATSAGIATYSTNAGVSTYATSSGIATYATNAGTSTSVIGGIASVTQLYVSPGITTVGFLTASNVYVSGVTTSNAYYIGANQVISSSRQLQSIASLDATTTATIEDAIKVAPNDFNSLNVSGISTLQSTTLIGGGTSTGTASQLLQVTGGAYIAGDSNFVGLGIGITNNVTYPVDVRLSSGTLIAMLRLAPSTTSRSATVLYSNAGSSNMITGLLNSTGAGQGLNGLTAYAGVVGMNAGTSPLILATNALERVRVFDTGEVGIGTTVLTGTASQLLQVSGGAYVSGNLGIGRTTNPTSKLSVVGDVLVSGVSTFIGDATAGNPPIFAKRDANNAAGIKLYATSSGNFVFSESTSSNGKPLLFDTSQQENIFFRIAGNAKLIIQPSGELLVGSATSTGTANQTLQNYGGAYVSGNIGIGTTNSTSKLHVVGDSLVTGIVTATSFSGNASSATYATNAGVTTYATSSGIATYATSAGFSTNAGIATYATNAGVSTYATLSGIATYATNAGTSTSVIGGIASVTQLNVSSGITTVGFLTATNVYVSGVTTSNAYLIGATQVISSARQLQNIASLDATTTATIESAIQQAPNDFNSLNVSGISTLQSTTLIGGGTSTGTASQPLQVTGGAYVSGSLGIGATNPTSKLQVQGDGRFVSSGQGDVTITHSNLVSTIRGASTVQLALGANGTEVIRINNSNQVGIGTTNPTSLLHVQGNTLITGIATVNSNLVVNGNTLVADATNNRVGILTTTPIQPFQVGTAGTNVVVIDSIGEIGIGTTSPLQKLHVLGNLLVAAGSSTGQHITQKAYELNSGTLSWEGTAGQLFSITNNLTSGSIFSVNDVSGIPSIDVDANGTVSLGAYGGNIGIGTTNPTSKLDVVGNVKITGISTLGITSTTNLTSQTLNVSGISTLGVISATNLTSQTLNVSGISTLGITTTTNLTSQTLNVSGVSTLGVVTSGNIYSTGIVTAAQFSTGVFGIGINTDTISGPSIMYIDPSPVGVGTTSGIVRIRGDLYVDGTQFIINSSTIELADLRVGIATTVGTNLLLDGGGIGIGSANILKTITWNNTASALTSSEDWNLVSGKQYEIDGTSVLNATTLGSGVVNSSLTSVGTLGQLQVTGISTFTNGPVLIGTGTETGTATQRLQVTGGAYVSTALGIGRTNPGVYALDVNGIARIGSASGGKLSVGTGMAAGEFGLSILPYSDRTELQAEQQGTSYRPLILQPFGSNVGIGTTNPKATLQVKDALAFETTNTTTTSTSQVAVDTFATATFRSAKYQVQMTCPGQLATLGGITTGGSGYTAGTFNVTFSNSSGTGAAAQGTLTISNGTVSQIGLGTTGGSGYTAGDVLTAAGGSGLQVSVASTASPSGRILTLGSITSAGIGYTAGVGVGTTTLAFLGGTGTGAVGLATIFDGVITSSTLLQQPTTGTGGTTYYSGSNYTTATVLTIAKTDVTNTITDITGSVGVSTFTSLTAHGIGVSDVVRVSSTSNGLTAGNNYFVVTVPTTTTFTLGSSVGIGTTFTTGSSLSIGFYRNSANAGGSVAYLNAITGISTNYQVSDLLVLQNGTTADYVEYAGIANNDILGTFAADISGANTRLLLTPTYATNTVKVARQVMTV